MTSADADQKLFRTLQARATLGGYGLARSDAADGRVRMFLGHCGLVHEVILAKALERFTHNTETGALMARPLTHIEPIGDTFSRWRTP